MEQRGRSGLMRILIDLPHLTMNRYAISIDLLWCFGEQMREKCVGSRVLCARNQTVCGLADMAKNCR